MSTFMIKLCFYLKSFAFSCFALTMYAVKNYKNSEKHKKVQQEEVRPKLLMGAN